MNPVLNHVVQIYSDGTIMDLDEKNKLDKESKKVGLVIIIILFVLLCLIVIGVLYQAFSVSVDIGRECGREIVSCPD